MLAKSCMSGVSVPDAVSAGFKFAEDMLKGGQYFV